MKVEVEEVDARPLGGKGSEQDPEKPDAWEMEIGKAGKRGAYVFSDGSLLESGNVNGGGNGGGGGNVGGGGFIVRTGREELEVKCGIGSVGWRDCRHGWRLDQGTTG